MKRSASLVVSLLIVLLAAAWQGGVAGASRSGDQPAAPEAGAPTVVSYQGQVTVGGTPYTGPGYLKFAVVDLTGATTYWSNDGTSAGEPATAVPLPVSSGLFNVLLGDTSFPNMTALPASAFSGTERYLRVWFSSDGSIFVQLNPDRRIAAVPYALQAEEAKNAWALAGNAGTTPGTNYLGTSDNTALQLHVNGQRALRIEPTVWSPNLIGGYSGNWVTGGVYGATIGGGGSSSAPNSVTDIQGTVGGGFGNRAGDNLGTVTDRTHATVGGGYGNTASGQYATVGGGYDNTASGYAATVGGGDTNTASGERATVAGGRSNSAGAVYAAAGGGYSNDASGFYAAIAGGDDNTASGSRAAVGGGQANIASGDYAAVPGGASNKAGGAYSFAAGRQAKANNQGCFVWADATAADFTCATDNQFAVRATGGVNIQTGAAPVQVNGSTVWHAGNDGSGSTLDADLLDGQHAAAFAASTHNHDAAYVNEGQADSVTSAMIVNATVALADIGQNGCTGGQVMQWNGTAWACASVAGVTDHGALTGLADDDHPQYFNLSQAETVAGIPAFNGGTSGSTAPFSVDSTTLVTNLNADLLDGVQGSAYQLRVSGTCGAGNAIRVVNADGTVTCEAVGSTAWALTGNAGTTPGTNYLGTSDNQALELKVNAARVLRLEPNATSPNLIGGYSGNWLTSGVLGATIGGGGASGSLNRVTDNYSTVGGGLGNQAGDNAGTTSDMLYATVSGGWVNTASNSAATVGGGRTNTAGGWGATIAGGSQNAAAGDNTTIGGGESNTASSMYATIAGGYHGTASGAYATIGGGYYHTTSGAYATVSGGYSNSASNSYATVSGGESNSASGNDATVPGGASNTAAGAYSFAAGRQAKANNQGCFVWADSTAADFTCSTNNQFAVRANGGVNIQTGTAAVQVNGNTVWHAGNDGSGSTLDADLLDGQHLSAVQTRVTGTCAVGSAISTINADGTVSCESHDALPVFSNSAPSPESGTSEHGEYTSLVLGTDGLGLISYYNRTDDDLKVAHCTNPACTAATVTTLDSGGDVGQYTSIAIGVDGLGLISYYDVTNTALKVAHCSNTACTSATITTLDNSGSVGQYTSVTIGTDGLGLISYRDTTALTLTVAHCSNTACTAATHIHPDGAINVGEHTSVAIGADGVGLVAYYEVISQNLRAAHCNDVGCTSASVVTVDSSTYDVGRFSSVTIGVDGLPLISYYQYLDATSGQLKVAHCGDLTCSSGNTLTTHGVAMAMGGAYTSATIGADGLPVISLQYALNKDLAVAHCSNVSCTAATLTPVATTPDCGYTTSMTIGMDGLPLISSFDETDNALKVVHCSNLLCTQNVRRR